MKTLEITATEKKRWVAPVVLERSSLADAQAKKRVDFIEVSINQLQSGPHS